MNVRTLTKVAPNIYRRRSGRWVVRVNQNGQRINKTFPPKTPRAEVQRFVQNAKGERRLRPARANRRLTKVAPNIFQTTSGRWRVIVRRNGQLIAPSFAPETPRNDVERFVENVRDGRRLLQQEIRKKVLETKREFSKRGGQAAPEARSSAPHGYAAGQALKRLLDENGLSYMDLVKASGVEKSTVYRHASGRMRIGKPTARLYVAALADLTGKQRSEIRDLLGKQH
jgi:hypothetical protein